MKTMKTWIVTALCVGMSVAASGAWARDWSDHRYDNRYDNRNNDYRNNMDYDDPNETWSHFLDREAQLQDRIDAAVRANAINMGDAYGFERGLAALQMKSLIELNRGSRDVDVMREVRREYHKISDRLRQKTGR